MLSDGVLWDAVYSGFGMNVEWNCFKWNVELPKEFLPEQTYVDSDSFLNYFSKIYLQAC